MSLSCVKNKSLKMLIEFLKIDRKWEKEKVKERWELDGSNDMCKVRGSGQDYYQAQVTQHSIEI